MHAAASVTYFATAVSYDCKIFKKQAPAALKVADTPRTI